MKRKPVKPIKIEPEKFYIVDLEAKSGPTMLWNVFDSEDAALDAIVQYLKNRVDRYVVCKGFRAIRHKLRFFYKSAKAYTRFWISPTKYNYPDDRLPGQKRKTWRTIQRRKLRKLENP